MKLSIKLPNMPEVSAETGRKNSLLRIAVAAAVSISVMLAVRFGLGL